MMTETEEKRLVDTLFGVQEEALPADSLYDKELPHFLFDDDHRNQTLLPLVRVPHYHSRVISQPKLSALIPYLNEKNLFEKQWGYAFKSGTRDEWCLRMKEQAAPILNSVREVCEKEQILQPKSVFSYVYAVADGNNVKLLRSNQTDVLVVIPFERLANGVCLADKFNAQEPVSVAIMAINMGRNAADIAKKWLLAGQHDDYKYLDGFIREMVWAMGEYTATLIVKEGCCVGDLYSLGMAKTGKANIQSAFVRELDTQIIDISFSRNYLMGPEYSALALVLPK